MSEIKADKLVRNEINAYCIVHEIPDPIETLVLIMNGYDPRYGVSDLVEAVNSVQGEPNEEEWKTIKKMVNSKPYSMGRCTVAMAARAAEVLLMSRLKCEAQNKLDKLEKRLSVEPLTEQEKVTFLHDVKAAFK